MNCDICSKDVNYIVYILVALFAISSWIDINGLWVELPILVQNLPEKWNLPSYMAIIIQIANIGPLIFTVCTFICPRKFSEIPVIFLIIFVGAISCLLLTFLWNSVTVIAGVLHSTALLTLQFFLSLVDCTSSVAFYTFMARLQPQYMTALFVGESLSGLIPSLVALAQGAGQITCVNATTLTNITINMTSFNQSEYNIYPQYHQPKFSIEIFFFFLFAMMCLSGISFTLLNYLPYCKKQFISETDSIGTASDIVSTSYSPVLTDAANSYELNNSGDKHFLDAVSEDNSQVLLLTNSRQRAGGLAIHTQAADMNSVRESVDNIKISKFNFALLSILMMWISGLTNGVLPSIQSYSCLPYGNDPYHLAVTLSSMSGPIACFVVFFVQVKRIGLLVILTIIGTGFASYAMAMAVMSPAPFLIKEPAGAPLIILAWIFTTFILIYCKVAVATAFRVGGRKALLWCGVFTQIGSAVGAFIMFILINQLHYFATASPCR